MYNWLPWPCYAFCKYTRRDAGMHSGQKKKKKEGERQNLVQASMQCVQVHDGMISVASPMCRQAFVNAHGDFQTNGGVTSAEFARAVRVFMKIISDLV